MVSGAGNTSDVTLANANARCRWPVAYKGVLKQFTYCAQTGNPSDSKLKVRLNADSTKETEIALTNLVANTAKLLPINIAVEAGDFIMIYQASGTLCEQFVCSFQEVVQEADISH